MENKRYSDCLCTEVACEMTPETEELLTALKEQRNHNRMVYEEGYDAGKVAAYREIVDLCDQALDGITKLKDFVEACLWDGKCFPAEDKVQPKEDTSAIEAARKFLKNYNWKTPPVLDQKTMTVYTRLDLNDEPEEIKKLGSIIQSVIHNEFDVNEVLYNQATNTILVYWRKNGISRRNI
jgi:hypothetical protein